MQNQTIDHVDVDNHLAANRIYPIRVIHVDDIQNSISRFYEMYAHEPVIIKGVLSNDQFWQSLTPNKVEQLLRGQNLYALDQKTLKRVSIPASQLFDGFRRGVTSYNVFHTLDDTPLADKFELPPFLQFNWFADSVFGTYGSVKGIMYSAKGTFTPLHIDYHAAQAWMYVAYGKKVWECYPPKYTNLLFDPLFNEFYNPYQHSKERFPLIHLAEKFVGTIEAGDFLFVPAGWVHQVETLEETFALSGVIINDFQIENTMKSWLWERALDLPGEIDIKHLIVNLPPERMSGEEGYKRTQAALALCKEWEEHILRRCFTGDRFYAAPQVTLEK